MLSWKRRKRQTNNGPIGTTIRIIYMIMWVLFWRPDLYVIAAAIYNAKWEIYILVQIV